ncbi:MAG TPA: FAD:protein FMN transferase [Thermodesulfobacteriota bacterium]|nr:FAD:protein FMN transferase [Thermodesulfobacteriota bacterium]
MNTILTLVLIGLLAPKQVLVERAFFVMGTNLEFKVYCENEKICNKAIFEAYSEVKKLDDIFSNYKDDSVLSNVNSRAGRGRTSVPQEFIELTDQSLFFSGLTDGAFDITVGKAMELWKTGGEKNIMPGADEIEKARECVGFKKIKLYPKEKQVELESPCTSLDFGGIGKGYAVDKAVAVLRSYDIEKGIVNFSGNIYAIGPPPGEDGWIVGVRHPGDGHRTFTSLKIRNMAIATSGDYEKYFEIKGKRFSHIIDPRSGLPVESVPSVTIISKSATEADALSTGFSVMGRHRIFELLENLNGVGVMIILKEENKLSVHKSSFFKKFEVPYSQPEDLGAEF